ncbi:MAG: ABC transporter permease, partial [Bacillota bacterium]|nr:ABC transporter permease [Bacillota bacterium]
MRRDNALNYIGRKVLQLATSMFALSIIVFLVSRIAPGDPMRAYYGDALERMSTMQVEAARTRLGLDDSMMVQYLRWLGNVLHGDFGISYQYKQPAINVIEQVYGNTLALAGFAFTFIFLLGLLLAIFCIRHEGDKVDRTICRIGVATSSVPEFFAALVMVLVFAVYLGVLPHSGAITVGGGGLADRLLHLVLPVATIVITHLWYCAYLMRNRLSDEVSKEYVLLCKAKGLTERQIIYKHCMKNIMPSVVSIMAIFLPHLLGGAYIIEVVFSYPGLGKLGLDSA